MPLKRLRLGMRIVVHAACPRPHAEPVAIGPAAGTVARELSRDNSAWVALDRRVDDSLHPFPANDPHGRGLHVLAWPEDCEAAS